jgi:hypothetical protein
MDEKKLIYEKNKIQFKHRKRTYDEIVIPEIKMEGK